MKVLQTLHSSHFVRSIIYIYYNRSPNGSVFVMQISGGSLLVQCLADKPGLADKHDKRHAAKV